jgi:SNF2 family DNA or RNA helicase
MPHQKALLRRCIDVEKISINTDIPYGIMSDDPGAGKTYVILGIILLMKNASKRYNMDIGTNMIIVPQNIYGQWLDAIREFTGNDANILSCKRINNYSEIHNVQVANTLNRYDIVLSTPMFYNSLCSMVYEQKVNVHRVFIDEIDSLSWFIQAQVVAKMMWFVSASIENMFDKERGVMVINDKMIPLDKINEHNCCCDPAFVSESFSIRQPQFSIVECKNIYVTNIIPYIFEDKDTKDSVYAHDFGQVKFATSDQVPGSIFDVITLYAKDLKERLFDCEEMLHELENSRRRVIQAQIDECRDSVKRTRQHIENMYKVMSHNNICTQCFTPLKGHGVVQQCSPYMVCEQCSESKEDGSCILCGSESCMVCDIIPPTNLIDTGNEDKISALGIILDRRFGPTSKFIIFSKYIRTFKPIIHLLEKLNIRYLDIDGNNIDEINKMVDEYKKGDACVMLMNAAHFGCGMNLENTTDIIFFHKMEPLLEKQVIGRGQRHGRTNQLHVWYLIYQNE